MSVPRVLMDDLPMSRFHWKITLISLGGPLIDGYVLTIVALALPVMYSHITPLWAGLIGASALIGMFIGGLAFGAVTDRVGRRAMFVLNLVAILVLSLVQLVATEMWEVFVLRVLIGIVLGADYPIATAMVAEIVPRKKRGPCLVLLILAIYAGMVLAYIGGGLLSQTGEHAGALMLASPAVLALFFLLLRAGTPESPRWLLSQGRTAEARAIVDKHLGEHVDFSTLDVESKTAPKAKRNVFATIPELFRRGYGPVLLFCAGFWVLQVAPSFAVRTFQPTLLTAFNVKDPIAAGLLIAIITMAGSAFGLIIVNRWGRRPLLIWSFVLSVVPLAILGFTPTGLAAVVVVMFITYNVAESAGASVQFVYPNELFPTDLRATGVGVATALSRIGAATGTFLLPMLMASIGVAATMFIAAGICLVGLLISVLFAPETRHLNLDQASDVPIRLGRGNRAKDLNTSHASNRAESLSVKSGEKL